MKQIPDKTTFYDYFNDVITDMIKIREEKKQGKALHITSDNVFQIAIKDNLEKFDKIVSSVMLDGSCIKGFENLKKLYELSQEGKSCIVLSKHVTNFDVPNLHYLLQANYGQLGDDIFQRLIFIAGRKLSEESDLSNICTEIFNRIVIVPKLDNEDKLSEEEIKKYQKEAMSINISAQKEIRKLKNEKWILLVYPTGTRERDWDPSTKKGIRQVENYIKSFDYYVCMSINGRTLLPQREKGMIFDYVKKDIVLFNTGEVQKTEDLYNRIDNELKDKPDIDKKQYVVDDIMKQINKLHDDVEPDRLKQLEKFNL